VDAAKKKRGGEGGGVMRDCDKLYAEGVAPTPHLHLW